MPDHLEPPFLTINASRTARPHCRRHDRGHTPHFIPVRLCHTSSQDSWRRVVVMDATADVVVLADDDHFERYRNHETHYLRATVSSVGAEAMMNTDHGMLFLAPWPDGARSVFSLADAAQPLGQCSFA